MPGDVHLRCKSPECESTVIISRGGRRMYPLAPSRVIAFDKGDVTVECGDCFAVFVWKDRGVQRKRSYRPGHVFPGLSLPSSEQIVPLMEERWAEYSKARLRERGAVATGLRFDVFVRDNFRCRYCGMSAEDGAVLHADHVVPRSKGGPTTLDNLVAACMDCNIGKSNKMLPDDLVRQMA